LVKVTSGDQPSTVTFAALVPDAPPGTSYKCPGTFLDLGDGGASLPWPPTPTSKAPNQLCGSQRPPINVAPAVAPDGTIYTVSVAHFNTMEAFLIAVNPDLTLKWDVTLQKHLTDGCGVLLPIAAEGVDNEPNSCRYGTTPGVDPTTNAKGSGTVEDEASATPTVLPDGSVIFGVTDNYDYGRGHLLHFDSTGKYINAYTFGWDSTGAVYTHDNTFSVVIKDNHYPAAAYCSFDNPVCTPLPEGPYYVSQLDANLNVEWSFQNTTINEEHPNGYEWCVNAPAIDSNGVVYITSEDGRIYSVPQGNTGVFTNPLQKIFLKEALGAAYTPLSIGADGKIYSQNDGNLFLVGQ
jgi:outer membrane protein assembly factor BamB